MPAPLSPHYAISDFQTDLLGWYHSQRRTLPWREEPSAYKTVVSEFMLQQTQVKTVLPYFHAWLKRFPSFQALARAEELEVLKAWEGLGYYSRARNLHKLARAVTAQPSLPTERTAWLELPGIGPYTSAAIASIAFNQPVACVDGNVVRILSRIHADDTSFADGGSAVKRYTPLADALVNTRAPGDHNQAMMELGATVCHRQSPLCTVCPVFRHCRAGQQGDPEHYPQLAAKKIERVEIDRVWCVHRGALLLHRRAEGSKRLAGQHELPAWKDLGLPVPTHRNDLLATKKRGITKYLFTEKIWRLPTAPKVLPPDHVWAPLATLDSLLVSGPHRRWINELQKTG